MRKRPKDEIKKRVLEAAEILGIEDLLNRKPKQLSGGQRQRVAVGRAIVRKPEVFLFDEPLSNLDAKLRVQTRVELKKLHERLATTAVYVTHDQIEAMTMGDRIVVMKDGLFQQVGGPLELYNTPANRFVAGFLGSPAMNFFEAELTGSGDSLILQTGSFNIDLPLDKARLINGYGEKKVIVGIRPEDLVMVDDQASGNAIPFTVDVVEPIGSETYVDGNAGDIPLIAGVGRKASVEAHQNISLKPIIENLHLFDIKNEKTILSHNRG
jgi:multiple sugar transport system ATP-binding protein